MAQNKPKIEPYNARFWVNAPTRDDNVVFVTGNCYELGHWDPDHALALDKIINGEVVIPYREPLTGPYVASTGDPEVDRADLFGVISDEEVDQIPGYLTDHSSIQFTLDPGGIQWQAQNYHERKFRVRFEHAEPVRNNRRQRPEYKVARFFREGHTHEFMRQSKHGPLLDSQPMIYRCDMHVLEVCHVRIDFYEVGREKDPSIPPLYSAYSLIAGTLLKGNTGRVTVPIRMPARQQVLRVTDCGELTVDFTIAKAMPRCFKTARTTLYRPWRQSFHKSAPVLHIGHRGSGSSYTMCQNVCENTIESFNQAAEAGADYVEFDVMFDVDMTPIIYHDHTVLVKGKDELLTEIAVKDINHDMLCSDRVFHMSETDGVHRFPKTGPGAPFPTLEHALKVVDPDVGFNVEVKYPMLMADGTHELNPTAASSYREQYKTLRFPFWSKNHFVDGILYIVTNCAGNRPIIFSSFDLDICIMLRLKQLQYPVFLLTSNDEQKGLLYDDVRINYLKRALYSAAAYQLEGIVCQTAVMYQHSWFLPLTKKLKLKLILYGESNDSVEAVQDIRKVDLVNGIIYNGIHNLVSRTKDGWKPKVHSAVCPPQDFGFIIGYTGFVPGRLDLVGTDSAISGKRVVKNCILKK
ncbi:putative glycerophosphocholine phosphodiesterase GPCPD1-like protein 2 [Hypsibius exemplaris]|uniref:Glycerophosphocholine phosphodiesterase GPCPD1-like protein 2 n=1 Tax=Hypsibius exemplaris TaxID=2072580 RepID=A0A1W0W8U7_HYPEX|nr:putative glycerophosphocholine phosphodiesterase GPCPD1-like protein 2 [Hypsibius exemplaris]